MQEFRMKIQYASDLHLEFDHNRELLEQGCVLLPVGDVLVLAGDVSILGDKKMLHLPFFDWCAEHFQETLIVPGNHEFYGGYDIGKTLVDYEVKYRDNVRYLNNKSFIIGDVELFFTTLWTHINPVFLCAIQRGMNDFRHCRLDGTRLTAHEVSILHDISKGWLGATLKSSDATRKIVVTHHCPTERKEFNKYPGGPLNSAFQVNLDSFIEQSGADYWIYGHTHYAGGSGNVIGNTKLICNQMGYVNYGEGGDYVSDMVLEI